MELGAIVPELVLAGTALVLVPVAGWVRGRWRALPVWLAGAGLLAAIAATVPMLSRAPRAVFHGTYAVDGLAAVAKLLLASGALLSLALLSSYFRGHPSRAQGPVALLFSTLGAVGLAAALDLGLIVLFLQMVSLASYLLVALVRGDRRAQEATLKYFVYAAAALAVMAYGLSWIFGLTGSLDLRRIGPLLSGADPVWLALAAALVLVGYGFEATLVPFHFWAPDTYEGASAPVAGFLSVVPKVAAFAALVRFALTALPGGLAGWPATLAAVAAVTMTAGNLLALRQSGGKRLLAYSSIAQAGYVLAAVAAAGADPSALPAAGYYLAAYLLMNLGAFAVIGRVERAWGDDRLERLRGLGWAAPRPAAALTLFLLSLAGLPPLGGFVAKVLVLDALLAHGLGWLAVVAAANMTLALYYYLRPIATMYLGRSEAAAGARELLAGGAGGAAATALCAAGTLLLGVWPRPVVDLFAVFGRMLR